MRSTNVTILTEQKFVDPAADTPFIRNILKEESLVRSALESKGLKVERCSWDDFGGTVHHYHPTPAEITFAEEVVARCGYLPVYARVDAIWDNAGRMAVSELELIEPELWFRFHPGAANQLAEVIVNNHF